MVWFSRTRTSRVCSLAIRAVSALYDAIRCSDIVRALSRKLSTCVLTETKFNPKMLHELTVSILLSEYFLGFMA
jgi:hypothetical protein